MNRPRVYVTQLPHTRDAATGRWRPRYDLTGALAHGELIEVLPPDNLSLLLDYAPLISEARRKMRDFNPESDYILAMGDPAAIAVVAVVANELAAGAGFKMLKWDKRAHVYAPATLNFNAHNSTEESWQ